ncbi:shufflon system plasmid conjugative transfer pilus tip adhesin PilV [Trinickia acidisoli]|uniref:shufflon system plasmid conjugative transfer pilus tip adhesin PilV n=1 Tax=Trinickia acidisoli TaxID=2767482 RepID=UPI001A903BB5|nr:shufflon system plasmid conjugative transfer pilus tip adhesin PilV [Trinickia acidisoli]
MDSIVAYTVALVLSMMGVVGFVTWGKVGVTNVQAAATASEMLTFDKAAVQYVQDNGTTIAASATTTTPVTITTAMLIASNYLPPGFAATNPFGQTWELQVLLAAGGHLQSLVTSQGGNAISNVRELVQIAAQVGAQGGFIPYANQAGDATMSPSNANGAYGGWKVAMTNYANPGAGHLASLLDFIGTPSNNGYLYRVAVAGQPQLNAMQTDLSLTDTTDTPHNINGVATINATQANLAGGPNGSLNVGSTQFYGDSANTAVRQSGGFYVQTQDGSGAASIDEVNNITAIGTVSAPTMNFNTTANNCSWGQATMRGNNQMWICNVNGNWVSVSQLIGNVYTTQKYLGYEDGWGVGKPNCGPGGTATATIVPQTAGVNVAADPPWETSLYRLNDEGTWWYVQISLEDANGNWYSGNNLGLTAEVDAQCQYGNE